MAGNANGNPTPGDLVLVRWIDSCSPLGQRWVSREGLADYGPVECSTVGRIVRRDKMKLVLIGSWTVEEVGEVLAVPASCVKGIEVLRRMEEL